MPGAEVSVDVRYFRFLPGRLQHRQVGGFFAELKLRQGSLGLNGVYVNGLCHKRVEATIMAKLNTKEDVALLVAEASEMFEETGYVPDVDGKKVRAERIVPLAKRYILETIDNPKSSYDTTIWHSPGYTLVLSWLSKKWLRNCQKFAPTVLKDVDLHLPKDQRKLCLDWAADDLIRQITRRQRLH